MPSHIIPTQKNSSRLMHRKPIRKELRIARSTCKQTPSDCDTLDENTMAELNTPPPQENTTNSLKELTQLLKIAIYRFKYSADTHLVALSILALLKFQIPEGKLRLFSAALLLIAGKVHEFRTPKFVDLLQWGQHEFGSGDLVRAQAQILQKINFRIPVVFQMQSIKAIEGQIARMEGDILSVS